MIKTKQIEIIINDEDKKYSDTERIMKTNKAAMAFLGLDEDDDKMCHLKIPK